MDQPWSITARWLFPVSRPPIANGVVTIAGTRIVAVEPAGSHSIDFDLGNVGIVPGLVNAHTHLDLSGARGLVPPTADFTQWLRGVVAYRRTRTPEEVQSDIRIGLEECLRTGTTLVGDIAAWGTNLDTHRQAPIRSTVFSELLGVRRQRAEQVVTQLDPWWQQRRDTDNCREALSPHAPYSVRSSVFSAFGRQPWASSIPVATHLAETAAELELLSHRQGTFVAFLQELGVWDPDALIKSPNEVIDSLRNVGHPLFIHANYLPPDVPIPAHGTIVYCPRTHAAFGHPPHPFRDFLSRGIRVALGTDSLASNPDLDLLAEVRFLHKRYPDVPSAMLLHMATLAGAEALGWGDVTGSLSPDKSADLAVIPLADQHCDDPHNLLFDSVSSVRAVMCRGRWVHGNATPA
jgi:cytosine/adenosine deaminase-related metal-dependent hydrolase